MQELIERIHRGGPVPYSALVQSSLYGPTGFYTRGGGAGRRRDFLTSPEVGTLFGAVIAQALDSWWMELGRPDPFLVGECGAGTGALAQAVLAAEPTCTHALRYLLVETSEAMRALHRARKLPLVEAAEVLAAVSAAGEDGDVTAVKGQGPLCASLPVLPAVPMHVIVANELLDNLPFDVLEKTSDGWNEIRVGLSNGLLSKVSVAADGPLVYVGLRFAPGAEVGTMIPVATMAANWVSDAYESLVVGGRLVCVDYAAPTADLATRGGDWLRTYRDHKRAYGIESALRHAGDCDITIDVPIDQLPPAMSQSTQAAFLECHGLQDLLEGARKRWEAGAAEGTRAALHGRSWLNEADALVDLGGLGGFVVLEWKR